MAVKKRPGMMLYFEDLESLYRLDDAQLGVLVRAMARYAPAGENAALEDPMVDMAFSMFRFKLDHDRERYEAVSQSRATAARRSHAQQAEQVHQGEYAQQAEQAHQAVYAQQAEQTQQAGYAQQAEQMQPAKQMQQVQPVEPMEWEEQGTWATQQVQQMQQVQHMQPTSTSTSTSTSSSTSASALSSASTAIARTRGNAPPTVSC